MASSSSIMSAPLLGFSIMQPYPGMPLEFFPALGSQQLDDLIDAFIPGQAPIQDKRAAVTMDFFQSAAQTGETFKFYPVFTSFSPDVDSPSSSSMYDSGYGSPWDVSPTIAFLPSPGPAHFPASASPHSQTTPAQKQTHPASPRGSVSSVRPPTTDFSHLPGMKIMTKDGRDVTNSASRGCKTKEQRDHAHLMRILKACDACKKKKVRCDPSHRKQRASSQSSQSSKGTPAKSQPQSPSQLQSQPPPKVVRPLSRSPSQPKQPSPLVEALFPLTELSDTEPLTTEQAELPLEDEAWDRFLQYPQDGSDLLGIATDCTPIVEDYSLFGVPSRLDVPGLEQQALNQEQVYTLTAETIASHSLERSPQLWTGQLLNLPQQELRSSVVAVPGVNAATITRTADASTAELSLESWLHGVPGIRAVSAVSDLPGICVAPDEPAIGTARSAGHDGLYEHDIGSFTSTRPRAALQSPAAGVPGARQSCGNVSRQQTGELITPYPDASRQQRRLLPDVSEYALRRVEKPEPTILHGRGISERSVQQVLATLSVVMSLLVWSNWQRSAVAMHGDGDIRSSSVWASWLVAGLVWGIFQRFQALPQIGAFRLGKVPFYGSAGGSSPASRTLGAQPWARDLD